MQLHGLLLIYQPRKVDGRLSWPGWLTHSGHLTLLHMSTIDQV